jgi:AAA+ ATPase superfamily predicted ATPase
MFKKIFISIISIFTILMSLMANNKQRTEISLDNVLVSITSYSEILQKAQTNREREKAIKQLTMSSQVLLKQYSIITSVIVSDVSMNVPEVAIISFNKIDLPCFEQVEEKASFTTGSSWKISLPMTRPTALKIYPGERLILKCKASLHNYASTYEYIADKSSFIKLKYKAPIQGGFAIKLQPVEYSLPSCNEAVTMVQENELTPTKNYPQEPKPNNNQKSKGSAFSAFFPLLIIFILFFITKKLGRLHSKGDIGESRMIRSLSRLPDDKYTTMNNITIPDNQGGTTQIDHIVISKYGLFVIETKNYSGWIFGDKNSNKWTASYRNGKKHTFQNPLNQNKKNTATLNKYLELPQNRIFSVVAFVGDAELKKGITPDNVFMTRDSAMTYIKSKGIEYFSVNTCQRIKENNEHIALEDTKETREAHISYLRNKHNKG